MVTSKKVNPRRVELIELSTEMRKKKFLGKQHAKTLEEALYWEAVRINDLILDLYYQKAGTRDFKTYSDWFIEGFKIKRGEKGWIIWAKKREAKRKGLNVETADIDMDFEFFPTCYLFNVNQVEPANPLYQ